MSEPVAAAQNRRASVDAVSRRARAAVAALFLTNGALYANILPRYPEIKDMLGLDNTGYGLTVIAFPIGAIIAGLAAGAAIRHLGSAAAAVFGTVLTGVALLAAGFAPNVWLFAACLLFGGAMDAITDVAQNAHGLRVQRRYGRSIINSFHAVWSLGAVLGASMAAGAIAVGLPIGVHLTISAGLFAAVSLIAWRALLPGKDEKTAENDDAAEESIAVPTAAAEHVQGALQDGAPQPHRPTVPMRVKLILLALVVIATAGALVEDAGFTWSTLYLTSLEVPGAFAASGLIALVGAQFVGRLVGDRLVDRFGQRTVAQAGGVIVALGMGTALLFPTVMGSILGFAAAGFGVATLVPAAMQQADDLPGLRAGTGLTVVSWLMRVGFLVSPPMVGMFADAVGLRLGLLIIPVAGLIVLLCSGALGRKSPSSS